MRKQPRENLKKLEERSAETGDKEIFVSRCGGSCNPQRQAGVGFTC